MISFKQLVFLFLVLCCTSSYVAAMYVFYKTNGNTVDPVAEAEHQKAYVVLLKYSFPVCQMNALLDSEIDQLAKDGEEAVIQKNLPEEIHVKYLPVSLYQLFFILFYFNRDLDLRKDSEPKKEYQHQKELMEKSKDEGELSKLINCNFVDGLWAFKVLYEKYLDGFSKSPWSLEKYNAAMSKMNNDPVIRAFHWQYNNAILNYLKTQKLLEKFLNCNSTNKTTNIEFYHTILKMVLSDIKEKGNAFYEKWKKAVEEWKKDRKKDLRYLILGPDCNPDYGPFVRGTEEGEKPLARAIIYHKKDLQLLTDFINLECFAYDKGEWLLCKGANEAPIKAGSEEAYSWGTTLFGGSFLDPGACAYRYISYGSKPFIARINKAEYLKKIPKGPFDLFFIPPMQPFAEMAFWGENFHSRTKVFPNQTHKYKLGGIFALLPENYVETNEEHFNKSFEDFKKTFAEYSKNHVQGIEEALLKDNLFKLSISLRNLKEKLEFMSRKLTELKSKITV